MPFFVVKSTVQFGNVDYFVAASARAAPSSIPRCESPAQSHVLIPATGPAPWPLHQRILMPRPVASWRPGEPLVLMGLLATTAVTVCSMCIQWVSTLQAVRVESPEDQRSWRKRANWVPGGGRRCFFPRPIRFTRVASALSVCAASH